MAMNKTNEKLIQSLNEQRIPRWKQWADKKVPQFRLKKTPPERELSLNEMSNELRLYFLEHPEVEKVFNQPSFEENDSSTVCYKLEIKSHIKGFNLFEFWYMKQLPSKSTKNIAFYIILVSIHFSINYFSPMNQRDEVDAGINNLVFDVNNKERPPWRCCSNSTVPRSEVIFFVQVSIIVLMIILCFSMLFLLLESCEEKSIWIALLSSLVGYILFNPKL